MIMIKTPDRYKSKLTEMFGRVKEKLSGIRDSVSIYQPSHCYILLRCPLQTLHKYSLISPDGKTITTSLPLLPPFAKLLWLQISQPPVCFLSYCWTNSKDAADKGSHCPPEALGWGDPRQIKKYLQEHGVTCWLDIEQAGLQVSSWGGGLVLVVSASYSFLGWGFSGSR
jgi:hypothetical protein